MAKTPREARIQLVHEKGQAGDKLRPQPTTWVELRLLGDGSPSLGPAPPPPWIEIEMVGEDDQPIPGLAYELELPGGTVRKGQLGDDGRTRVEGFTGEGDVKVTFPDLDQDAWEVVRAEDGEASTAAALLEEDHPVAGERYRIELPDGTVHKGLLEDDATVRFEGIPRGPCKVSFFELDQDAWEEADGAEEETPGDQTS